MRSVRASWKESPALLVAMFGVFVVGGVNNIRYLAGHHFEDRVAQPLWWLSYSHGFVRRGLPGEILAGLTGDHVTVREMHVVALLISGFAVLSLAVLAWRTATLVAWPLGRIAVLLALLASPLSLSLPLRDIGRYDAIGFVLLVALAFYRVPGRQVSRLLGLTALVVGLLVATASEEFLLLFLAPVAVLAASAGRWRSGTTAVVLIPPLGLALACLAFKPSPHLLAAALQKARGAGARVPSYNAVENLDNTPRQEFDVLHHYHPSQVLALLLMCLFLYALSIVFLRHVFVRVPSGAYYALVGYFLAVIVALSAIGVDYRRWTALAFVGLWAAALQLHRNSATLARISQPMLLGSAAALLVLGLADQVIPIFPNWLRERNEILAGFWTVVGIAVGVQVARMSSKRGLLSRGSVGGESA